MHLDLFEESFFFCPRSDLESLQLVRRALLNVIVAGSNVLPLRSIDRVEMDFVGDEKDYIQIIIADNDELCINDPDYEASIHEGDFAETFRRLQHTCVKEFCVGIRDSPFLRYWKAQEAADFSVVSIDFAPRSTTDYGVLDSIVNHLRPRTAEVYITESSWHANGYNSDYLAFLARDSFLNNLQICRLRVFGDGFPPSSFVLEGPGYQNYKLHCAGFDVADRFDGFVESFVRDGCANEKLDSVCITWDARKNLQSAAPKQLNKPTKADLPLPTNHLTAWFTRYIHRVTQCEMHSFVNKKQWKRMEVFKWSVDYDDHDYGRRTAHVLHCRLKNL